MPRLHKAAADGNLEQVQSYVSEGDDVNDMSQSVTSKGETAAKVGQCLKRMTPLHLAAYNGHTSIAIFLVEVAGADINVRNQYGDSALEIAVQNKNLGLAVKLQDLGAIDEKGVLEQALANRNVSDEILCAATRNKPDVIFDLHSHGLLNDKNGKKALYYAAKYDSAAVAEALISCGISPTEYYEFGGGYPERSTFLGIAAEHGSEHVIELLLNRGVNVDDHTRVTSYQKDCTPLRQAILHSGSDSKPNPQIVKMLLSHGADVNNINPRGLTCLASSGDPDELELLLQAGLSPNVIAEGKSLLDRCISRGNAKLAITLINYGADISYVNENGQTYLHRTRDSMLTKTLIAAFIEQGLDVNVADINGRTPVECCSDSESIEIMLAAGADLSKLSVHDYPVYSSIILTKQLIDAKLANFSSLDNEGKTPLRKVVSLACTDNCLAVLEYILENASDVAINRAGPFGGWTALHEAFAQNQGFVNIDNVAMEDKYVAESNYTKAIDLLIKYGAKPIKDNSGRTPLMCLTFSGFSRGYNSRVIERFYRFEADYYGVDPEIYKKELLKLRSNGFKQVVTPGSLGYFGCTTSVPKSNVFDEFWKNIEAIKTSSVGNMHDYSG